MVSRRPQPQSPAERDIAVDDFIALLRLLDDLVRTQSSADAGYFMRLCERSFSPARTAADSRDHVARLSLAVHRFGRSASAYDQDALRHDDAIADATDSGGVRAHRRRLTLVACGEIAKALLVGLPSALEVLSAFHAAEATVRRGGIGSSCRNVLWRADTGARYRSIRCR